MQPVCFGEAPDGRDVFLYTIANKNGISARISNFGGVLQSLFVRGKDGRVRDIVQGFEYARSYHNNKKFIGATIGRYVNVIRGAEFVLNGKRVALEKNFGRHHLHGGFSGLHNVLWNAKVLSESAVHLSYLSPDSEGGYPGNLLAAVTFSINENNALEIKYDAICDKDTVIGFTNHAYFNLDGHNSCDFLQHELWMNSDFYALNDTEVIPTGEICKVEGTPFDFRKARCIGSVIGEMHEQLLCSAGYDHNMILNGRGMRKAASLYHPVSGITMDVRTDMPGLQLYTDNDTAPVMGKEGAVYNGRKAICLETQGYPNSPNISHFPSPLVHAGERYHSVTQYCFCI
jgi:aldose 1-epimerase